MKKLTYLIPLVFLMGVSVIGQVGFSSNIGTALSGGGGGGGVSAGVCPAGQVMTAVSVGVAPTCTSTLAAGTLTASAPFSFTQTWNNSAVTFHGIDISITGTPVTDYGTNSTYFRVSGGAAGTTCLFGVGPNSGCVLTVNESDGQIYIFGELNSTSSIDTTATRFPFQAARQYFDTVTANTLQIAAQSGGTSVTFMTGAVPALTSGWGTGATIVGNSSVGRITIGTAPSGSAVLTFVEAFATNAPHCDFNNETSGVAPTKVTPTTALVTVTTTLVAADSVSYHCIGFQ